VLIASRALVSIYLQLNLHCDGGGVTSVEANEASTITEPTKTKTPTPA
jgi:hypothetical protein